MKYSPLLIDAALLAVIAVGILDGRRRGFVRTAASLFTSIISAGVAYKYARPLALRADEAFVNEKVSAALTDAVSSNIASGVKSVLDALPDYVLKLAGGAVEELAASLAAGANASGASERLFEALEKAIIIPASTLVAFLAIFVLCRLILSIAVSLTDAVFKLPVIRKLNGFLGGLAGALKGTIGAFVVAAVFYGASILFPESVFSKAVENSTLQNFAHNIINSFLT